jgi:hypothetical protein
MPIHLCPNVRERPHGAISGPVEDRGGNPPRTARLSGCGRTFIVCPRSAPKPRETAPHPCGLEANGAPETAVPVWTPLPRAFHGLLHCFRLEPRGQAGRA